jgi:hypothetical protein
MKPPTPHIFRHAIPRLPQRLVGHGVDRHLDPIGVQPP